MAKTPMRCPFNGKMCAECPLFRGRHYFLCANANYRGYIKPNENIEPQKHPEKIDLKAIKRLCEPWSVGSNNTEGEPKIMLKVINKEKGTTRACELDEAKEWEWKNPETVITFRGSQINSFEKLREIVHFQEARGAQEVTIIEAPWFMIA